LTRLQILQVRERKACLPDSRQLNSIWLTFTRTGSRVRELASIVELVCDTCRLTGAECERTCWEASRFSECASDVDGSRAWCDRLLTWAAALSSRAAATLLLLLGAAGSLWDDPDGNPASADWFIAGAGAGGRGNSRGCEALAAGGSGAGRPSGGGDSLPGLSSGDGSLDAAPLSLGGSRIGDELPRRLDRLGPLPIDDMFCRAKHRLRTL